MAKNLSKARIVQAAFAFADQNGLGPLSMRRLSEAMGVQAMSLYNHVANKNEILDALVERGVGEIYLPDPARPWRRELETRCNSAHTVLTRHRWLAGLLLSRINSGITNLTYFDRTLACLHAAGFSLAAADHAINALDSFVYGFTMIEQHFPFAPEEYATAARQYQPMIPERELPALYALTGMVARHEHKGIQDLEYGLKLLLDGLENQLQKA